MSVCVLISMRMYYVCGCVLTHTVYLCKLVLPHSRSIYMYSEKPQLGFILHVHVPHVSYIECMCMRLQRLLAAITYVQGTQTTCVYTRISLSSVTVDDIFALLSTPSHIFSTYMYIYIYI